MWDGVRRRPSTRDDKKSLKKIRWSASDCFYLRRRRAGLGLLCDVIVVVVVVVMLVDIFVLLSRRPPKLQTSLKNKVVNPSRG